MDNGALILYKSSGGVNRFIGEEDFCGNGCLLVDDIRIPFPDCINHASPFTTVVSLEV